MPLFISFEGPDGSGKSTQARLLAEALRTLGYAITETREPGGTPLGERVRELLLDPDAPGATPLTMALLLSAARAQLVDEVICPALQAGQIVIVNRFADSTVAYQSYGLGLDRQLVKDLTAIATNGVLPTCSILVDIPSEVGVQRVATRGHGNRLDAETLSFHRRVRAGYLEMTREDPDRWVCVDGTASVPAVHRAIMEAVQPRLATEGWGI